MRMRVRMSPWVLGLWALAVLWGSGEAEGSCSIKAVAALRAKAAEMGAVRVIVGLGADFRPEGDIGPGRAFVQQNGIATAQGRVLARLGNKLAGSPVTKFRTIPYMAMQVSAEALKALLVDPDVISVQEDGLSKAYLNDTIPLIHAPAVWSEGQGGSGWCVAILDSGVDKSHPFLAGKVVSEACYTTTDSGQDCQSVCPGGAAESTAANSALPPLGGTYGTRFYHGTHVAGIAAGSVPTMHGVARSADIIAIQVFSWFPNYGGQGKGDALSWASDQIRGMERVYALRNTYKIAAVNMSLGSEKHASVCDKDARKAIIDNLRSVGIATVISSGNDGYSNATGTPGCISTAVTVGATNKYMNLAPFSNIAYFVDLLAPGVSVWSSIPYDLYAPIDGTSMATPHVTGAFAVLKAAYPYLSVAQIEDGLKDKGIKVKDGRPGTYYESSQFIQLKETYDSFKLPFPSIFPTVTPMPIPSYVPIITKQPTLAPVPTIHWPTVAPTTPPTGSPTAAPTGNPTGNPTVAPTGGGGGGGGGCSAGPVSGILLLALPLVILWRR